MRKMYVLLVFILISLVLTACQTCKDGSIVFFGDCKDDNSGGAGGSGGSGGSSGSDCVTNTITFTPGSFQYVPPEARNNQGDLEFDGNGPDVYAGLDLQNYSTYIDAKICMKAKETKSDWTEANGCHTWPVYYAPSGCKVLSITSSTSSGYQWIYTDSDHAFDIYSGSGPVWQYRFYGDGPGDDVEYHTRVIVDFRPISFDLRCCY